MSVMYGIYEIDPECLDSNSSDGIAWKSTANAFNAFGTYDGRTYFIKRSAHYKYPVEEEETPAVYKLNLAMCKDKEKKFKKISTLMKGLSFEKDHIALEERGWWCEIHRTFNTATAFLYNKLPEDYDYTNLSQEEFLELAIAITKILQTLHGRKVIHTDIKDGNILVSKEKNEAGGDRYVPWLIDFDSAKPNRTTIDHLIGTRIYRSPEIALCGADEEKPKSLITTATDIFSLGLVFHRWWTGALPPTDMERGTVHDAVYEDMNVFINKKFDIFIGEKNGATLLSLINWMIAKNPMERPTAEEVLKVLSDDMGVPEEFHKGKDVKPFDTELWPIHLLTAKLHPLNTLKKKVRSFKRINDGTGSDGLKYLVTYKDGTEKRLTIDEICEADLAKTKDAVVQDPWEEDHIEFVSAEKIRSEGYIKIERVMQDYEKRYLLTYVNGITMDKGYEWLIKEGLANLKEIAVDSSDGLPWEEHGKEYDAMNKKSSGIDKIERIKKGGEHCYKLTFDDGMERIVPAKAMLLMELIK